MKQAVALSIAVGLLGLASCSSDDDSGGGSGGSGGSSATGGTGGSATGGTSGSGGSSGSSGASGSGGSAGSSGAGGADAGGDASDGGSTDGSVDAGSCTLGEACCTGGTCNGTYTCLGTTCGCIIALHGDLYLRSDGQVFDWVGKPRVIEVGATGQPLTGITEIFDGSTHGCALKNDGTVWCWAANTSGNGAGQLGQGNTGGTTVPRQAKQVLVSPGTPLKNVAHINSGSSRSYIASTTCAILTDKTLWCWGADQNGGGGSSFYTSTTYGSRAYATQMMEAAATPLTGVDQIGVGRRHMCIRKSGDVYCWGVNVYGALGIGSEVPKVYPTKLTLPGPAVQLGVGSDASCARVSDKVYCWGVNNHGQLGVGTPVIEPGCSTKCQQAPGSAVLKAAATPLTGVVDLNVAYSSACARLADHSLHCWGIGASDMAAPLMISGAPVVNVALHTTHGSGNITATIRHLTRDNVLKRTQTVATPDCQ